MFKTHEKSRFEVMDEYAIKDETRVILQIAEEKLREYGETAYFVCETVAMEEYDRITAEGRAAAAEKELADEIEAHRIEMEEAQAKIDALEELLAEAQDAREGVRNAATAVWEENQTLYKALVECRRIFEELPPEIETLIAKGEN